MKANFYDHMGMHCALVRVKE